MLDRIIRVMRLDRTVFAEVEGDESLTAEAFLLVVMVSILAAFGTAIGAPRFVGRFVWEVFSTIVFGWGLWSYLVFWVGTNIYEGDATLGEMLRVIGYANAPRLLSFFGFIPVVGWLISLLGVILSVIAAFMGIQEGLDLDAPRTLATVIIGWVISFALALALGALLLGPAIAIGILRRAL